MAISWELKRERKRSMEPSEEAQDRRAAGLHVAAKYTQSSHSQAGKSFTLPPRRARFVRFSTSSPESRYSGMAAIGLAQREAMEKASAAGRSLLCCFSLPCALRNTPPI